MSSGGPSATKRALPVRPQASSIKAEVAGQWVSSSMASYNDVSTRSNAAGSLMSGRPHGSCGGTHQEQVAWEGVRARVSRPRCRFRPEVDIRIVFSPGVRPDNVTLVNAP